MYFLVVREDQYAKSTRFKQLKFLKIRNICIWILTDTFV